MPVLFTLRVALGTGLAVLILVAVPFAFRGFPEYRNACRLASTSPVSGYWFFCWNAITAFSVPSPKFPSALPVRKPSSISASCREMTSGPVEPLFSTSYPPASSSGESVGIGVGVGVVVIFLTVLSTMYSVRTQPVWFP